MDATETQPAPGAASANRILANTGFRAIADIGSKIASIALYVVMARRLGDSAFGVFTFGMAFVTLVTMLANMGQQAILTREVARERGRVHEYFVNTLSLQLVLAVPALLIAVGVYEAIGLDADMRAVVLLLGVAVVAEALVTTCFATFQAYERLGYIPIVLVSQRWLTAGAGIAALALGAGVVTVSAIYLAGALVALALALYFVVAHVARPRLELELRRWLPLMRVALPIGIAGVFSVILFRIDVAMLQWLKTEAVVGQYGAAYRLLESTLFISWSIGTAVYPVLSRLSRTTATPVAAVFQAALKLAVALTLPLTVGAAVLAYPLMELLYGSAFRDGASGLIFLAPTILLYPLTYIAAYVLMSQGRQAVLAWVYGGVALVNVGLNLALIPRFSLDGAAFATSFCELLTAGFMLALALRATGAIEARTVAEGPLVATAFAAVAMVLLNGEILVAVPVAVVLYAGALALFERRFHPDDYARVMRFLRRRSAPPVSAAGA